MMHLAVAINHRDSSLIPKLVSIFTRSSAYHVELVFSDDVSLVVDPKGLRFENRRHVYRNNYYNWVMIPLEFIKPVDEFTIRDEAVRLVKQNPKYDFLGACFGWLGSRWNNENRWYCSEIAAYLLRPYIPYLGQMMWVTPEDLWYYVTEFIERIDNQQRPLPKDPYNPDNYSETR